MLARSRPISCPRKGIHIDGPVSCRSRIPCKNLRIGSEIFSHPVAFFLCPCTTELMLTRHLLSLPIREDHNISVSACVPGKRQERDASRLHDLTEGREIVTSRRLYGKSLCPTSRTKMLCISSTLISICSTTVPYSMPLQQPLSSAGHRLQQAVASRLARAGAPWGTASGAGEAPAGGRPRGTTRGAHITGGKARLIFLYLVGEGRISMLRRAVAGVPDIQDAPRERSIMYSFVAPE